MIGKKLVDNRIQAAITLHKRGQLLEAKKIYESILIEDKKNFDAMHMLGLLFYSMHDNERAEALVGAALAIRPNNAEAHCNYGLILEAFGRQSDAMEHYNLAIKLKPRYVEAYINRGTLFQKKKNLDSAFSDLQIAIAISPNSEMAHSNMGLVFRDMNNISAAAASFRKALEINPFLPEALVNLGCAYASLGKYELAKTYFEKAIETNPTSVAALSNYAATLRECGQYDEALRVVSAAVELNPRALDALTNKGAILIDLEQYEDAVKAFSIARSLSAGHVAANWGTALALLALGRFDEAWSFYEFRIGNPKLGIRPPKFAFPRWQSGKQIQHLVVVQEQGIGDTVFFARALTDLKRQVGRITLVVDPRLLGLFRAAFLDIDVLPDDKDALDLRGDSWLLIGSVYTAMQVSVGDLRRYRREPYLNVFGNDVSSLRARLLTGDAKLVCGVAWKSFRPEGGIEKSIALEELKLVFETPNVSFVSLQYGDVEHEIGAFNKNFGVHKLVIPETDNTNDLVSHARLVAACDFVITVSNTTAHIAGAIGKSGIVLVSRGKGKLFYWNNVESGRSFWYPSLQVLNREIIGGNTAGVDLIKHRLLDLLENAALH